MVSEGDRRALLPLISVFPLPPALSPFTAAMGDFYCVLYFSSSAVICLFLRGSLQHANPSSLLHSIIFILIFLFLSVLWVCQGNRGSFPVPTRSLILYENTTISHFSSKQKPWEEAVSCAEHSVVVQQLEEQRCWCALQRQKWSFEKQGGRDYVRAAENGFLIP